jgi:hypothetical protein
MEDQPKLFAFRLAAKERRDGQAKPEKWKARDGVALAGCTDPLNTGDFRERDGGMWC